MTSEEAKFEIIDFSGERMSFFTLQCSTVMIVCMVLTIIGFLFYVFYLSIFALFTSIGIIIVFLLYGSMYIFGNHGMLRKFTIFESKIEILLPRRKSFLIKWTQIDEIKVRLNILNVNPFQFYEIIFLSKNRQYKINLDLKDFKRENLMKILEMLKLETVGRKKKFSATKEEIISGIYLVDDLEI
ncbi:MAG: hypothetical protein ACTSV5_11830 [Promethearchaeota archaeon]